MYLIKEHIENLINKSIIIQCLILFLLAPFVLLMFMLFFFIDFILELIFYCQYGKSSNRYQLVNTLKEGYIEEETNQDIEENTDNRQRFSYKLFMIYPVAPTALWILIIIFIVFVIKNS